MVEIKKPMPNFYIKTTTELKSKNKNSGLKDISINFILQYSSSIEVLKCPSQTVILTNN